ncbi:Rab3 GTPase-activating protein catalytic subunit [Chytriomyces hyalinus]|nr:Rab3 GTPase-activating protein catalytic subunit [Chytriomyces hyalinus]
MAGEEEEGHFEIVDYSVSGPMERLISELEQVFEGVLSSTTSAKALPSSSSTHQLQINETGRISISISQHPNSLLSRCLALGLGQFPFPFAIIAPIHPPSFDSNAERAISSAVLIALRSTGITMPVFLPVGSTWRSLYTGVMLSRSPVVETMDPLQLVYTPMISTLGAKSSNHDTDSALIDQLTSRYALDSSKILTRFRMFHSPFIPSDHAELAGLRKLFVDRLSNGFSGDANSILSLNVSATGSYTYGVEFQPNGAGGYYYDPANLMDEVDPARSMSADDRVLEDQRKHVVGGFPTLSVHHQGLKDEDYKPLPVGPSSDPVAGLELECRFDSNLCDLHFKSHTSQEAEDASEWVLHSFQRSEGAAKHGRLFSTMSVILDSWVISCSTLQQEFTDVTTEEAAEHDESSKEIQLDNIPPSFNNHHPPPSINLGDALISRPENPFAEPVSPVNSRSGSEPIPVSSNPFNVSKHIVKSSIKRFASAAATTLQDVASVHNAQESQLTFNIPSNLGNPTYSIKAALLDIFSSGRLPSHILDPPAFDPAALNPPLRTINAQAKVRHANAAAPFNSILWRLGRHILATLPSLSSALQATPDPTAISAACYEIWNQLCRTLRERWESGRIPLTEDAVDLRESLIVQKLGMLGYCLKRRVAAATTSGMSGAVLSNNAEFVKGGAQSDYGNLPQRHQQHQQQWNQEGDGIIAFGTMLLNVIGVDTTNHSTEPIAVKGHDHGATMSSAYQPASFRYGASWNSDRSWEDFGDIKRASISAYGSAVAHTGLPGALNGSASILEDAEDATEYYDHQTSTSHMNSGIRGSPKRNGPQHRRDSLSSDADMFFDTLDFHDIPPKSTPKTPSSKTFNDAQAPSTTVAGPTRSRYDLDLFEEESAPTARFSSRAQVSSAPVPSSQASSLAKASSLLSDDSSGIVVGSMSPKAAETLSGVRHSTADATMDLRRESYEEGALKKEHRTESFIKLRHPEDDDAFASVEVRDPEASVGAKYVAESGQTILATGAVMLVPELQESGCMTEDMILEQERVLLAVGTSAEAAGVRARMQTGQLKSDMESFKAANPHARLEDFVRWHSPRDWIEDSSAPHGGKLSPRMNEPGNLWQEVWTKARRIPASKQKPLFDYEKEGEKVLFYMEELGKGKDLMYHLLPTLFHVAYDAIASNPLSTQLSPISRQIPAFTVQLTSINWAQTADLDLVLSEFCTTLSNLEYQIGVAQSLLYKLPMQVKLVEKLLSDLCSPPLDPSSAPDRISCVIESPGERKSICDLLSDEGVRLSVPSWREYVLRTSTAYPTPTCRVLPQRMYALLKAGEFRVFESIAYDEDD